MQYLGGKSRIASAIADVVAPVGYWWEPFCGGLNVSVQLAAYGPGLVSDVQPALITLYQALRAGWKPPTRGTAEQYAAARDLPDTDPRKAFIGFGCSFSGKWMAGYVGLRSTKSQHRSGREISEVYSIRNAAVTAAQSVRSKVAGVAGCELACLSFFDVAPEPDRFDAIYCDPPYAGTTGYDGAPPFDSSAFWRRCAEWAATDTRVFVSEYAASDAVRSRVVWAGKVVDGVNTRAHALRRAKVERLFQVLPDGAP